MARAKGVGWRACWLCVKRARCLQLVWVACLRYYCRVGLGETRSSSADWSGLGKNIRTSPLSHVHLPAHIISIICSPSSALLAGVVSHVLSAYIYSNNTLLGAMYTSPSLSHHHYIRAQNRPVWSIFLWRVLGSDGLMSRGRLVIDGGNGHYAKHFFKGKWVR